MKNSGIVNSEYKGYSLEELNIIFDQMQKRRAQIIFEDKSTYTPQMHIFRKHELNTIAEITGMLQMQIEKLES